MRRDVHNKCEGMYTTNSKGCTQQLRRGVRSFCGARGVHNNCGNNDVHNNYGRMAITITGGYTYKLREDAHYNYGRIYTYKLREDAHNNYGSDVHNNCRGVYTPIAEGSTQH